MVDGSSDKHQIAARIKGQARELGFDLAGIAPAGPSAYRVHLRQWLDDGRHGTMQWLANRFAERTDPSVYLPGAASVICVAINYAQPQETVLKEDTYTEGKVARYALGDDYHDFMKKRLQGLADFIRQLAPDALTRACVDTAPVMEKELAQRAGLGWVGKNTLMINPKIGSWTLLGEVVTTLSLPPDEPGIDRCGTCQRCLEACPTGALDNPYQLDARRCISYLTIENRGEIASDLQKDMGNWIFGCDICQEVCPWNRKAPLSTEPAFLSRFANGSLNARDVAQWTVDDYRTTLKGSAMKRVKLPILQRNAEIVMKNMDEIEG
jgi:epoxyqueuosine reductase